MFKSQTENCAKGLFDIRIFGLEKRVKDFFLSTLHIRFLDVLGFKNCDSTQRSVDDLPIHFKRGGIELLVHRNIFTCMAEFVDLYWLTADINGLLSGSDWVRGGFAMLYCAGSDEPVG